VAMSVKFRLFLSATIFVVSLAAAASHGAEREDLYVTAVEAKLRAKPSPFAPVLLKLKRGDRLFALGEERDFYKVRSEGGVDGYVAKRLMSKNKPGASGSEPVDELLGILGGGERTASVEEASSSHSIRGLKSAHDQGEVITGEEAEASVEAMEKFSLSGEELDRFQRLGRVGRYAR